MSSSSFIIVAATASANVGGVEYCLYFSFSLPRGGKIEFFFYLPSSFFRIASISFAFSWYSASVAEV